MQNILDIEPQPDTTSNGPERSTVITLCDGSPREISQLNVAALRLLQWDQEPQFARQIADSKRGTSERAAAIRQAYETICTILDEIALRSPAGHSLAMGMDRRYTRLVLDQLHRQRKLGIPGGLFEMGFGSGILLFAACEAGFSVGGLEVASQLHAETAKKINSADVDNLLLGDFLALDLARHKQRYSLVYWNDVFEHIAVDEISAYLDRLHSLLAPGGKLITITPNWHMRPSDITGNFCPPRTTARGFHLQEYTLGEVVRLLRGAGFSSVQTPCFIGRRNIWTSSILHLTRTKTVLEPLLETLPFRVAVQCCRRFGLSCTIATKAK
jgi:hypothetical protein